MCLTDYQNKLSSGRKKLKSITLILALATPAAEWAAPVTSPTTPLKDTQCTQSVCTTKCDAKNEKCRISCDDKAPGNNCKKNFNHVSPYGVLDMTPKRAP
jgi:hypothetical protein